MAHHYSPKIKHDGLVLHIDPANPDCYRDGVNTDVLDLSGNSNDGTIANVSFGPANYGNFVFNGSTSRITGTFDYDDSDKTAVTVLSWIYPTTFSDDAGYKAIINRSDGTHVFSTYIDATASYLGQLRCWYFDSGNNNRVADPSGLIPTLNQWNLVVYKIKESVGVDYYIYNTDGKYTSFKTRAFDFQHRSTSGYTIGRWYGGNYDYSGNMSVTSVYSRALPDSEIDLYYYAFRKRFGI